MSQNNSRSATVGAARRTRRFKEQASSRSSGSRARENGRHAAAASENAPTSENNRSASGGSGVGQKNPTAPAACERPVAALTLRAGGRVLKVAMQACGSTESRVEVLSAETLTLEQWAQLCDKLEELTHSMILLDHPDG